MSSVDERIVQMRFDNAQFESGVRQTLSSLDKLKQGLKFNAAINGANVLQNAFNGIKLGRINSSVDQLNRKFSSLGVAGMEIVKRLTNDALNSVNRIVTAIPNQIKAGGWARALNLENAQFQLKGLGVAWGKINNDIQYAVNGTAFGLDSAAKVAGQLAASNIQVSDSALTATKSVDDFSAACIGQTSAALKGNGQLDEMATALRSISGVAAMSNSSFEEIGQIYTRVAGQGRVMADDLNSIASRGLNAAATLGTYLGKTETEVRDMVSKGQIDFKTFSDAMYDAYADQAVKANNTFQGALSNTKSALSRIGADVADDLLPALTKILNSCRLLFNQVHKWIQPVLDSTGKLVAQIGDTLSPIIDAITAKIAKITGVAGGPIQQIAGFIDKITAKVKGVGNDILSYFGLDPQTAKKAEEVVKSVDTTVTASVEHITEMAKRVIRGDFGNEPVRSKNLEAIGENFEVIQNKVNELLGCSYRYKVQTDKTTASVNKQSAAIKQATLSIEDQQKIMRRNTVMNFFKGFENIGKTISLVFTSLGSSIKNFFSTLTPPDWSKFSSTFAKATGVIVNNADRIKEVKQVIDDIVFSIGNAVTAVVQVIGTLGKAIFDVVSKIKFKPPTEFTSVIRQITENLKLSQDSANGLHDIFVTLLSPLKLIVPLMQKISLFILKIVEGATALNKKFLEFVGKSKVLKTIQKIFENIGNAIKKIFDGVKNSDGFKKLAESFGKFKDVFGKKVLSSLDDFAGKLASLSDIDIQSGSGLDRVINFFSTASEQLSKVFDKMSDLMSGKINFGDIFAKLGEGLVGGISAAIGSIPVAGKLLGSFGTKLFNFFRNGNFKKQIAQGSASMIGGLSDTIKSSFEEEINKAGGIKSQITNYAQTVGQALAGFGTAVKEKFQSVNWKEIVSNIKENVGKVFDAIGSFVLNPKTHKAILTLISIAKDIASIFTLINAGKMFKSIAVNGKAIATSIAGFFGQLKTSVKEITDLYKIRIMFKDIGKALLMIVGAMAVVSLIEKYGDLETSLEVVGGIIAALSALFITVGKIKLDIVQISAFGRACSEIGFAILAIVASLAIVAHMNADMYREGLIRLIGLLGVYSVAMGLMFRIAGDGGTGINTGAILTFAIAVNLLIIPLKVLAHMDADAYQDGLMKLIGLLGTLSVAMGAMARIAGDGTFAGLGTFIGVAVAIFAITNALKSLSVLDTDTLVRNAMGLSEVFLAIGASFKLASEIKIAGIAGFVIAIAAVTGALMLLQNGPHPEQLLPIATGLGEVFIALGAAFKLMQNIKFGNALGAAVSMGVALAAVTGALMILQNGSNPKAVLPMATGLGIALVAAGASLRILDGMTFGNTIGAAVSMGIAITAAAGALAILNNVPNPEAVLPIAEGLSVTLVAVAAALRIMGGMGADIAGAVSAGASIGLAIDAIAVCVEGLVALNGLLAKIPGFEKVITDGLRIIKKVLVGLGDALGSAAGAFVGGFTKESSSRISDSMDAIQNIVASMKDMASTLSGTDFGSVLSNIKNLKKTIKELGKISIPDKFADNDKVSAMKDQFKSLTDLMHYIVNNLSDITGDTTSKITSLTDFIDKLKSFAKTASSISFKNGNDISSNIGELSSGLDSINTFCTKVGKIELSDDDVNKVENISKIIKTLSSSDVSGVGEGSFMGLKGLITGIGTFSGTAKDLAGGVNGLQYFFNTLSGITIDNSVVDKVIMLSTIMTQLGSATSVGVGEGSFIGLKGLITGIGSFSGTAGDLAGGIDNLETFFSTLSGITIDDTVVDKVTKLSSVMTQIESATSVGVGYDWPGIKAFFTGVSSFSGTAGDLKSGIAKLQDFFNTLSGITINDGVVDKVTKLSSMMTQMESATSTGVGWDWPGLKSFFTGISSFSGTAEDLAGGVDNIVKFATKIGSVTISENTVSNVEQIKQMMNALNSADIQETGGLKQFFTGVKDFSKYAEDLSEFSSKIQEFSNNISSISGLDTAYTNMQTISDILKYFSSESGLFSADAYANVTSIVDGEMFSGGGPLMKFITSISTQVVPALNEIQQVDTSNFESVMAALKKITAMSTDIQGLQDADFGSFASGIQKLASALTNGISGIDAASVDSFVNSIKQLGTIDISGLSTVADSLNNFITNGINKFKSGIENSNVTASINSFINKIESGFSASAFSSAAANASSAGKNIGSKFAAGLGSMQATARNKGATLGRAAVTGIKSVVGQAGPAGTSYGQRFAAALQSSAGLARSAGLAVGQNASSGLNAASAYASTSGMHFAQNFASGIMAGAGAAIAAAQSLASRIKNILGHTTPKEGPMKNDDVWGEHMAENFANGIAKATDKVRKSAYTMSNAVWNEVRKANEKGGKSIDDFAKSLSTSAYKYLDKARKTREVTQQEVVLYWNDLLDITKKSASAMLEENSDINEAIYKSAEQLVSDHKDKVDEYITNEADLWNKVVSLTAEGTGAREEALSKFNDALVSDADNAVTKYEKSVKKYYINTATFYKNAIDKAKEYGATQKTVTKLNEKYMSEIESNAEQDLSRMQTYYDMSSAQQALYWKGVLGELERGTDAYSKAEDKFLSARNDAWNSYTSSVKSTVSKLGSDLSLGSEFQLNDTKFDILSNTKNEENALKSYSDITTAIYDRGILSADNFRTLMNEFGVKDLKYIQQIQGLSDENLKALNDSLNNMSKMENLLSEHVNKDLKPDFLYTDKDIEDITGSTINVMKTISDIAGDPKWIDSVSKSLIGVGNAASENIAENVATIAALSISKVGSSDVFKKSVFSSVNNAAGTFHVALKDLNAQKTLADWVQKTTETAADDSEEYIVNDYTTLGNNLIDGLIKGIAERSPDLVNAVSQSVKAAIEGGRVAADAHSPARKTIKLGGDIGNGLVIGLKKWLSSAGSMGKNLGNSALSGMNYMLSALASDINDNMDMQPVIRPVIDMSDVMSSANAINSMLSSEQAMNIAAGYDTIAASRQNGSSGSVTNDNSVGSININIYPTENQNANDISDTVIKKLNNEIIRKRKVYA